MIIIIIIFLYLLFAFVRLVRVIENFRILKWLQS